MWGIILGFLLLASMDYIDKKNGEAKQKKHNEEKKEWKFLK